MPEMTYFVNTNFVVLLRLWANNITKKDNHHHLHKDNKNNNNDNDKWNKKKKKKKKKNNNNKQDHMRINKHIYLFQPVHIIICSSPLLCLPNLSTNDIAKFCQKPKSINNMKSYINKRKNQLYVMMKKCIGNSINVRIVVKH